MADNVTDGQLLTRLAAGDAGAFDLLIARIGAIRAFGFLVRSFRF